MESSTPNKSPHAKIAPRAQFEPLRSVLTAIRGIQETLDVVVAEQQTLREGMDEINYNLKHLGHLIGEYPMRSGKRKRQPEPKPSSEVRVGISNNIQLYNVKMN